MLKMLPERSKSLFKKKKKKKKDVSGNFTGFFLNLIKLRKLSQKFYFFKQYM